MGATWRAYSPGNDIIPGKWCAGNRGLGVLAELVPLSGTSGAGILNGPPSSLVFPADTGVEVRAELITAPGTGVLQLFDDSTAIYTNPTPGIYPMVFKYWRAGVDQGNATAFFTIGESSALAASINSLVMVGSIGAAAGPACALSAVVSGLAFVGSTADAPSMASLQVTVDTFTFEGYAGHPFDRLSPTQMTRPIIDFTVLPPVRLVDQLAAKDPTEVILLECYFDLPAGVTLVSGVFSATVETSVAGIADNPLTFLGNPRTVGRRVQQLVSGGTNLTRYRIRCAAATYPLGPVLVQTGILPVVTQ